MTTQAINSGAINETRFPGSQDGLSLIELIGTVEVVCSISAVNVLKTVGASTTATAAGSVGSARLRRRLSATTTSVAQTSAAQVGRVPVSLTRQTASAVPQAAGLYFALRTGASGSAGAVGSSGSIRGIAFSASGEANASGVAAAVYRRLVSASTTTSSVGSASAVRAISRAASTTAAALGSAISTSKATVSASTVASAIVSSAAADYGITQRSPLERLMFVPAENRRMEATL